MKRIYLDSNILIAHCSTDHAEESKKNLVEAALAAFIELKDVQLCTSMWAITEMVNVLVSQKKMDRGEVAELESQLVNQRRLGDLKIDLCEVSGKITTLLNCSITSGREFSDIIPEWGT